MNATKRKFNALIQGMGNRSSPSTPSRHLDSEHPQKSLASPSARKTINANSHTTAMPPSDSSLTPDDSSKRRRLGPNDVTIITSAPGSTTKISGISLRKWGSSASKSTMRPSSVVAPVTKVTNLTPPMSAAKYCPSDRNELIKRLTTFQEISDWTPKPDRVSEIEWAKRGWACQGKERVRCTLCHKELVVRFNTKEVDGKEVPVLMPSEIEDALVDKYCQLMVDAHQDNCLWRQSGCEDSLLRISFSNSLANFEALRLRYDELCARSDSLPYDFNLRLPEGLDLDVVLSQLPRDFFSKPAPPPKTSDPKTPNRVALALAIMGWQGLANPRIGAIPNSASCHTCLRRLGLWMFKSKELAPDGSIAVPAAMDYLDPAREHRFFCPWKNPQTQRLATARSKPGTDLTAWKALVQSIRNEAYLRERLNDDSKSKVNRMRSRSELPSTPTKGGRPALPVTPGSGAANGSLLLTPGTPATNGGDEAARDSKDKERWARLRRVKSLFDTKSSRKKKANSRPGTATSRPDTAVSIFSKQSGPEEAARAIRKKLKYGNVHRQLRALVILDGLIQNAGPRFQRTFANEPLLERLRVCATSPHSDPEVRKKCDELFRGWVQYKNIAGMSGIASLVNQLPRRKVVVTRDVSKAVRETENPFDDDEDTDAETSKPGQAAGSTHRPSAPTEWPAGSSPSASASASTSSTGHQSFGHAKSSSGFWSSRKKDKEKEKEKRKSSKDKLRAPINLQTERPRIKATIADSSLAATNLLNSMQVVNRETERISENQVCVQRFEECKTLRRQVLRYIHNIHSEEFLGGLLHANDELINALITFEQLDRSINADSDSDDDLAAQAHMYRMPHPAAVALEPLRPGLQLLQNRRVTLEWHKTLSSSSRSSH
ncbi:Protein lsb5 [Ceratocystis platani]|uniref:Protein lsb5 n=1 Tax=Ceratocystis fimbriata f. sp. platani TaxID=88771 RepID=A0A0F8B3Q6_CERFI|nr:Protein lsb5 [Ceratocystis platani]